VVNFPRFEYGEADFFRQTLAQLAYQWIHFALGLLHGGLGMGENAIKTTNDTAKSSSGSGNGPEAPAEWEPAIFKKLPAVDAGLRTTTHTAMADGGGVGPTYS
jgi:hypothetical protein